MQPMNNIVWLASWFPSKEEPLTGDFIKRHAEAVSLFEQVHVVHVKRRIQSGGQTVIDNIKDAKFPNLTYSIAYYSMPRLMGLELIFSYCYALWLYHKLIKQFIRQKGKPSLLHAHITLRSGWVALYYYFIYKVPYFVTEQYSGYMPEAKPYQPGFSFWRKLALQLIIKKAACFIPVSKTLGVAFQKQFSIKHLKAVYNVVNTDIFKLPNLINQTKNKPVFLHISTLTPQKNPEDMLIAFNYLKEKLFIDFSLLIVGPEKKHLKVLSRDLHLDDHITWIAETTQQQLAAYMWQADAFILYSRFETFGCVNMEAISCGLPVIVSDIPVFREYLQQGKNAFFAAPENPEALASAIKSFIDSEPLDRAAVADTAVSFRYKNIGSEIIDIYKQFLPG